MIYKVIHIYGASGSGTSTLGAAMAREYGYFHMDTDDYFWLPTDPMFTTKRDRSERIALMEQDIHKHGKVIITGSLVGWGDVLISYFDLAVRVVTDTDVRIQRLEKREFERFGNRIASGGDMHQQHIEFIQWAAAYDTGDMNMRSRAEHDDWQKLLICKQIVVDGSLPVLEIMKQLEKSVIW